MRCKAGARSISAYKQASVPLPGPGGYQAKLRVGTTDESCLREVFDGEIYASKVHNVRVEPGDKWIDLGAHIGIFALYAAQRGAKKVWSYERSPGNIPLLKDNAQELNVIRAAPVIELRAAAVVAAPPASGKGTIFMPKDPQNTWRPQMEPHTGKRAGGLSMEVDVVSFQSVLDSHSDATAIKMDIEGSEAEILTSPNIDWRSVRKLCFVYTRENNRVPALSLAAIKQRLVQQGWSIEYDPSAEVPDGANSNDPIIFATRPKRKYAVDHKQYQLGSGGLLHALEQGHGIVRLGVTAPEVRFEEWCLQHDRFMANRSIADSQLREAGVKFTVDEENLSRTIPGDQLACEPRSIFDVKARVEFEVPSDAHFEFFRNEYLAMRDAVLPLVRAELAAVAPWVKDSSLGNCILRHNIYPPNGVCGAHTDYGLCTLQTSTHHALEVQMPDGSWAAAPLGWVLYAGDMLEVLTNGAIPAVKHRVQAGPASGQGHVFFVQPSDNDVVRPADAYVEDGQPVRPAITYKDWHKMKVRAAFGR